MPLVVVCTPLPVPNRFIQPRPCSSRGAASARAHQFRIARTVRLAEGVSAGDERDGLFVVHGHAGEGFAHIAARGHGVGLAVGAFRVYIDQPHLHGGQGVLKLAVTAVAFVAQPGIFFAPVDVLFGLPDVHTAATEAEGLEAHRLQRAVAGQDHEVGPGDLAPVFLLDGPE